MRAEVKRVQAGSQSSTRWRSQLQETDFREQSLECAQPFHKTGQKRVTIPRSGVLLRTFVSQPFNLAVPTRNHASPPCFTSPPKNPMANILLFDDNEVAAR